MWHGFVYWYEWCNEQFRAEEYMPHGNRPPEKLAPGRSVASNCPYVVTEIQERYFILGLPGSRKRLRVVKKNKDLEYLERWPKGIKLLATMKIFH